MEQFNINHGHRIHNAKVLASPLKPLQFRPLLTEGLLVCPSPFIPSAHDIPADFPATLHALSAIADAQLAALEAAYRIDEYIPPAADAGGNEVQSLC